MIGWLRANAEALRLERWFLFASHPYQETWAAAPGGMALMEGTGSAAHLTELGRASRCGMCSVDYQASFDEAVEIIHAQIDRGDRPRHLSPR